MSLPAAWAWRAVCVADTAADAATAERFRKSRRVAARRLPDSCERVMVSPHNRSLNSPRQKTP